MSQASGADYSGVPERLGAVRGRIEAAGGDPEAITIVAMTKSLGPEAVRAALDAGLTDIGENQAQQLLAKVEAVAEHAREPRWHFTGAVQRNKVAKLAPLVHLWQAVDSIKVGEAIAARAPHARVMVEVDLTDGAPGRHGVAPELVADLVRSLQAIGLVVRGLMALGPPGPPEAARPGFRQVSRMADELGLPERSMGMSADLEVAVGEGATMVRIGTALLGPRPDPRSEVRSGPGPRPNAGDLRR